MKFKLFALFAFFLAQTAFATDNDLTHRPKSFAYKDAQAVFLDFTEADYEVLYDLDRGQAFARADIRFEAIEEGYPIFDSVTAPSSVLVDGVRVGQVLESTPSKETTLRVLDRKVARGSHRLQIEMPLTQLVTFKDSGVRSAFWTSDLDEREFLERYLPANFEFDQVKMRFTVRFKGLKKEQAIYTNGSLTRLDNETYVIDYPAYYTASSIFFHTAPVGTFEELRFEVRSIDGRVLPALVYSTPSSWGSGLSRLKEKTIAVIRELEADYGPFPHPAVLVYQAGSGGMEYCGATMTDFSSLGHELFHSYFARGVMPANGNSGWLDEALASWRDNAYPSVTTLSGSSRMSAHPYYTRTTDTAAYGFGARFMSYLDGRVKSKGGLKPFMRQMVANRRFQPLFVEEFIQSMSQFYQMSFVEDFKRYTYGQGLSFEQLPEGVHGKMRPEELERHL
jgi:hypothetical protein